MARSLALNERARHVRPGHLVQAACDLRHISDHAQSLHDVLESARRYIRLHIPLAYLLKSQPFSSLDLFVAPPILVPRTETEHWVDVLTRRHDLSNRRILDVGCGSGCIALSIAKAFPSCHVTGIDCSPVAIAVSRKNAQRNHIYNADFRQCAFDEFRDEPDAIDLIVSNPPYLPTSRRLPKSVRLHEARRALFSGRDGMDMIRELLVRAASMPRKAPTLPVLVFEFDSQQKPLLEGTAKDMVIERDQFGMPRTAWVY